MCIKVKFKDQDVYKVRFRALQTVDERAAVKSVNGVLPDEEGAVILVPADINAAPAEDLTLKADKSEIPTALPNPHKLTINGTEYDGSADVQMTIQSTAGKDGYTPVRGTDYWTADDIATIQSYIDEKTATLQSKSITDSGGHFATDTVEGALQEIGAELAGINTLLGSGIQISFIIEDVNCTANAGETFYEWIGSGYKYLENGMMLSVTSGGEGEIFLDEAGVYALSLDGNTPVHGGDKIISGATYVAMNWGG